MPPEVVTAWKHYFMSKFEQLNVVCFTSFPKDESERNRDPSKGVILILIHFAMLTKSSLNFMINFVWLGAKSAKNQLNDDL